MRERKLFFALFAAISFCSNSSILAAEKSGKGADWEVIFDGKSTDHLRGYKRQDFPSKAWSIDNGGLKTNPSADPVDLVTKENYGNFELELEWKVSAGANSGVMYHSNEEFDEAWNTGPEIQVLDDVKHPDAKNPKTSASALYALVAPKDKQLKPVGEWNQFRLVVTGKHLQHWLNGKLVLDVDTGSPEIHELIAKSKFAQFPKFDQLTTGHIVLQHHHDEVWFRNVRIRRTATASIRG